MFIPRENEPWFEYDNQSAKKLNFYYTVLKPWLMFLRDRERISEYEDMYKVVNCISYTIESYFDFFG